LANVVTSSDVIIVAKRVAETAELPALMAPHQTVIDLVGIAELGDVFRPWSAVSAAPLPQAAAVAGPQVR